MLRGNRTRWPYQRKRSTQKDDGMLLLLMITFAAATQEPGSSDLVAAVVDGYEISENRVRQQIATSLKGVTKAIP